jgi:DNA-directed RNA polymerase subunit alpha
MWLKLTVRCQNVFHREKIKTLGQLCRMTEGELLRLDDFGRKSLNEVIKEVQENGLTLWGSGKWSPSRS